MGLRGSKDIEFRFTRYVGELVSVIGHADRAGPFRDYCTGLVMPGERKSVEPMAARLAPDNVRRVHQSLHHLVADAPWSDEAVLDSSLDFVLPAMLRQGPVVAWVVDDCCQSSNNARRVSHRGQACRRHLGRANRGWEQRDE